MRDQQRGARCRSHQPGHPAWRDAGARQGHHPSHAHEVPLECARATNCCWRATLAGTHTLLHRLRFRCRLRRPVRDPGFSPPQPRQSTRALPRRTSRDSSTRHRTDWRAPRKYISIRCPKNLRRVMLIELELPPRQQSRHDERTLPGRRRAAGAPGVARDCAPRPANCAPRRGARRPSKHRAASSNEVLCRSMADISMLVTDTGAWPLSIRRCAMVLHGVRTRRDHHRDEATVAVPGDGARSASLSRCLPGAGRGSEPRMPSPARPGRDAQVRARLVRRGAICMLLRLHRLDTSVRGARRTVLAVHRRSRDARCDRPNVKAALTWIDRYGDADGEASWSIGAASTAAW